jgi:transcriptional regulator with XRE-family HTH domain
MYHPRVGRPLHELFEANVRRYASAKSKPLDAVARASGITTERLLAIFSGEYDPDLELVGRIAESLGVTASDLFAEPDFN